VTEVNKLVFGKKKKKVAEDIKTEDGNVVQVDINPSKKGKKKETPLAPEMSEEQKALVLMAQELKKEYGSYLTPVDAANVSQPVLQSEQLILLAGIFGELKKMNMTLQAMREED